SHRLATEGKRAEDTDEPDDETADQQAEHGAEQRAHPTMDHERLPEPPHRWYPPSQRQPSQSQRQWREQEQHLLAHFKANFRPRIFARRRGLVLALLARTLDLLG